MDPRSRGARPTARPSLPTTRPATEPATSQPMLQAPATTPPLKQNRNLGRKHWLLIAAGVILLAAALWSAWKFIPHGDFATVDRSRYQAVFLSNGQVYFGKVTAIDDQSIHISDVYYIQNQPQANQNENKDQPAEQPANNMQLTKLGQEIHAPDNSMFINREQVLFWENISNDGKVVQAINNYQQ